MRDMIHVKSPQLLTYVFAHDSDTCELNFAILNTSVTFLDHFTISSLKNMPTDLAGLSFSSQCGCVDTGWVPLRCSTGAVTHAARGGAGRGGARPHVQTVTGLPARPAGAGDASPGAGRSTRLQNPFIGRGLDFAMGEVASLSLKTLLPAMVKSADAITGTRQDVIQLT